MTAKKRWWQVEMTLAGWTVTTLRRHRPSKTSPRGYMEKIRAPGGPFGYAEAHQLCTELNKSKRRLPAISRTSTDPSQATDLAAVPVPPAPS